MISVEQAIERIVAAFEPLAPEQVSLASAHGRVLAEDAVSRRTQPPVAVSAMDGYAIIASDVAEVPVTLEVIGYVPAGDAHEGTLQTGQATRIFTGAPVPDGADAIVMQEITDATDTQVTVKESVDEGRYIRPAGLDFRTGDVGLHAGRVLSARDIGFAAAMNLPWLMVRRRPRIAILATGDEVVMPGDAIGANQIVSSNSLALAATITALGGEPLQLGIAPDDREALRSMVAGAQGADLLVTTGGVSVGEHDLVRSVLGEEGLELDFWQIAMRPGKPLMFGKIGETPVIGLPGNPVSTLVCAMIFIKPALQTMLGADASRRTTVTARLGRAVRENDHRQDYLRAQLSYDDGGEPVATPFPQQDSSMMARLAQADCLVVRPPGAPALEKGKSVEIIPIEGGLVQI